MRCQETDREEGRMIYILMFLGANGIYPEAAYQHESECLAVRANKIAHYSKYPGQCIKVPFPRNQNK